MPPGASRTKRFLEKLQEALTASALAEEGESDAARDLGSDRGGPAAVPPRKPTRSAGSGSPATRPRAGR